MLPVLSIREHAVKKFIYVPFEDFFVYGQMLQVKGWIFCSIHIHL